MTDAMLGVRTLEKRDSAINGKIVVMRDLAFGTTIKAGGITQSGGVVHDVWKNTLKKVKDLQITPKRCLILGLGGGSIAKISHSFWPEMKIIAVDLDPIMVEMGKKYMGLEKLPIKIVIDEAMHYCKELSEKKKKFDLILVDLYQGHTFPPHLESDTFINTLQNLLTKHGVIVVNRLFYGEKRILAYKFLRKLEKVFPTVDPVYPEANIMFVCRK